MKRSLNIILAFLICLCGVYEYSEARQSVPEGYFENPVYDHDFPDPAVVRAPDGYIYSYATQTPADDEIINIQVVRSSDLVNWDHLGDALPEKPDWADETQNFWAPDVFYDSETEIYYLYFSSQQNDKEGHCVGVATSKRPEGPFRDSGEPMICGEGFVHIDPMAFDDPKSGKKWLYWGSGFAPLMVQELADNRIEFKEGSEITKLIEPDTEEEYTRLIEGPWVLFRDDDYYMFYSGDNCCGENAHYATLVARAEHPTGPFVPMAGEHPSRSSVILEKDERWLAPGHNSVIRDDLGTDWILYHAIDRSNPNLEIGIEGDRNDRRVMLIDRLVYIDGWPRIEKNKPGNAPQTIPYFNN